MATSGCEGRVICTKSGEKLGFVVVVRVSCCKGRFGCYRLIGIKLIISLKKLPHPVVYVAASLVYKVEYIIYYAYTSVQSVIY